MTPKLLRTSSPMTIALASSMMAYPITVTLSTSCPFLGASPQTLFSKGLHKNMQYTASQQHHMSRRLGAIPLHLEGNAWLRTGTYCRPSSLLQTSHIQGPLGSCDAFNSCISGFHPLLCNTSRVTVFSCRVCVRNDQAELLHASHISFHSCTPCQMH